MKPGHTWHIGLTLLVPGIRGGRWLSGLAIFGALSGLFMITGIYGSDPEDPVAGNRAPAVFFTVILAYIVPVFHYISARTVEAIDALASDLRTVPVPLCRIRARIHHKPRLWFATVIGLGVAAAVGHNLVLTAGEVIDPNVRLAWAAMIFSTALTWVVLTLVVAALIDNAVLLNRLGRQVHLNLLNSERLRPFGSVAVLSTLSIIGAQAAFPIMIFDEAVNPVAFVPGLIATAVPMIMLAVLPIWPLHRRLRSAKQTLLGAINTRLAATDAPQPDEAQRMNELLPLLTYRREVEALSEWPFDVRIIGRLVLYLIIPPLTWIGAALIENAVDAAL